MSKSLMKALEDAGFVEYGATISGEFVRGVLGLKIPTMGTKAEFDEVALVELGAIDHVRGILLNKGMYIEAVRGNYRILMPNENEAVTVKYMQSADRKLRRAIKLYSNTPSEAKGNADQIAARLALKKDGASRTRAGMLRQSAEARI